MHPCFAQRFREAKCAVTFFTSFAVTGVNIQLEDSMWQSKKGRFLLLVVVGAILTAVELLHIDWFPGRQENLSSRGQYVEQATGTSSDREELPAVTTNTSSKRQTHPLARHLHTISTNTSTESVVMETERLRPNHQKQDQSSEGDNSSSRGGYVMAVDYWEQQTSGSRNLQSLQCWAAQYNLSVVEPLISRSVLKTPLTNQVLKNMLWFRDFYNIDKWNRLSSALKHSELVGWKNFIKFAPRNVVLVSFRHAYPKDIKQNLEKFSKSEHHSRSPSQRVREGCPNNWDTVKQFIQTHQFDVAREVCFNFAYGDGLSGEEFKSDVYGSLSPSASTVVFSQWRGTGPSSRVRITDSKCVNNYVQEKVGPSTHLLSHVEQYQQKYLGGAQYISIIARMEKVQALLRSRRGHTTLEQCFSKLLSVWNETKSQYGLEHTLLSIDMGKYGSNSIHHAGQGSELNFRFRDFFKTLYGGRLSVEEWEDSFEDVAHISDPGYVAALQQMLAVQAQCIVFIGGGAFQKHAHTIYMSTHQKHKCVRIIDMCTYPFKKSPHDVVY